MFQIHATTSQTTIDILRKLCEAHGLTEDIVSDNGPQFTSHEFKNLCRLNATEQTRVPPYKSASNGTIEMSVRLLKQALLKDVLEESTVGCAYHCSIDWLISCYSTGHSTRYERKNNSRAVPETSSENTVQTWAKTAKLNI